MFTMDTSIERSFPPWRCPTRPHGRQTQLQTQNINSDPKPGISAANSPFPTVTKQGSSWLATTDGANGGVKLNMAQFFVPRPNAASTSVGFLPIDADPAKVDQAETKGFEFYGQLALHVDQQSGDLQTSFYAQPTAEDGVKALVWNATDANGVKNDQIELRTVPPSSGPAVAASE